MGTVEYVCHSLAYLRTGIHCVPKKLFNCRPTSQQVRISSRYRKTKL